LGKNQMKASDARLYGVKLAMFIIMKHDEGKISESHFHSIVSYLPVIYRIFDTNTILTEQEERGFGDIRSISEQTTNRKSRQIIENCIIRFNVMLIFCRLMRQYLLILPFLLYICYVY
jgi:hypothetical protein